MPIDNTKCTIRASVNYETEIDRGVWLDIPFRVRKFGEKSIRRMIKKIVGCDNFTINNINQLLEQANATPFTRENYWESFAA